MLKSLNINDVLVTPYTAVKDRYASNIANTDLILFEHTGSDGGPLAVAIEFIDYGDGNGDPIINSSCSLANEKQSLNLATYREGKKIEGTFYSDEEQNIDGTYKRVVFSQVREMFYNNYRDPTKMWGMEKIDFDKSQTKKFLQDKFVMLDLPTSVMGEKIIPNSVIINDTTSDDNYIITDDGNCNLVIGNNVFSKHQELGDFLNQFATGSDGTCDNYFDFNPPETPILNSDLFIINSVPTVSLDWTDASKELGYVLERSISTPLSFSVLTYTGVDVITYNDYNVNFNETYYYRVYAYNSNGNSPYSNIVSKTILEFDPVLNLVGSIITSSAFDINGTASLSWSNIPAFPSTLSLYKSNESVYPTYTLLTNPFSGSTSYLDTSINVGHTYYYKLETSNSVSSSFTNEVSIIYYRILDTFDEYITGSVMTTYTYTNLSGGFGWVDNWYVDQVTRMVATESWFDYNIGQTGSFGAGFGLETVWNFPEQLVYLLSFDNFDSYTVGTTSSLSDGSGWSSSVWNQT